MDKCIYPSCKCKEYNEPKGVKGTLLQLKTGCAACGHQASLHRKLTSIDRFIQDELKKVKKVLCQHLIPAREIPRSPLFEPYDLIPLPEDDQCPASNNNEGGVQCTCKGFNSDIVRLWQKFRTHNLDHVRTELPKAICAFCRHPLSEHLARESTTTTTTTMTTAIRTEHAQTVSLPTSTNYSRQLRLKASSNITLPVVPGNKSATLELPMSVSECKSMSAVLLHRVRDSKELGLSLLTHCFHPMESDCNKTDVQLDSLCENGEHLESVSCDGINTARDDSTAESAVEGAVSKSAGSSKRGRKRKKSSVEDDSSGTPKIKRRSVRIAEKNKKREEEIERASKIGGKKKTSGVMAFLAQRESERESEEDMMIEPLTKDEMKYVNGNAVEFVQSMSKETCYRSCGRLPQAVSSTSHVVMATHSVVARYNQEHEENGSSSSPSSSNELSLSLVAVASEERGDVYVAPLLLGNEQVSPTWTTLNFKGSVSVKITCLSWMDTFQEEDSLNAFLAVGCSNGCLYVWKTRLQHHKPPTPSTFDEVVRLVSASDTDDQITTCQWSTDRKTLAVGTLSGAILFYSMDLEAASSQGAELPPPPPPPPPIKGLVLKHMQTILVCGGTVRCLAWSKDSRLLAVGGSDDHVQVLQSKEPKTTSIPIAQCSILKYFDVETRHRFVHTHSLRGHQSFIADLCFLGNGHRLVSIGWDSQLLIWHRLLLPSLPKTTPSSSSSSSSSRAVHHNTVHKELSSISLPLTEVEPLEGFKVGPSASVDFLPLAVCNFLDHGLFVLVRNRLGTVYVVLYTRS